MVLMLFNIKETTTFYVLLYGVDQSLQVVGKTLKMCWIREKIMWLQSVVGKIRIRRQHISCTTMQVFWWHYFFSSLILVVCMFSRGPLSFDFAVEQTIAITLVDRLSHKYTESHESIPEEAGAAKRQRRHRERWNKNRSSDSSNTNEAPLICLQMANDLTTLDWLIGPRRGAVCCSAPSPWHGESPEAHASRAMHFHRVSSWGVPSKPPRFNYFPPLHLINLLSAWYLHVVFASSFVFSARLTSRVEGTPLGKRGTGTH